MQIHLRKLEMFESEIKPFQTSLTDCFLPAKTNSRLAYVSLKNSFNIRFAANLLARLSGTSKSCLDAAHLLNV